MPPELIKMSWKLPLKLDLKIIYSIQPQIPADSITFSDTIVAYVLNPMSDTSGFEEAFAVTFCVVDDMGMVDDVNARGKNVLPTVFITDERYIKNRGS